MLHLAFTVLYDTLLWFYFGQARWIMHNLCEQMHFCFKNVLGSRIKLEESGRLMSQWNGIFKMFLSCELCTRMYCFIAAGLCVDSIDQLFTVITLTGRAASSTDSWLNARQKDKPDHITIQQVLTLVSFVRSEQTTVQGETLQPSGWLIALKHPCKWTMQVTGLYWTELLNHLAVEHWMAWDELVSCQGQRNMTERKSIEGEKKNKTPSNQNVFQIVQKPLKQTVL